MLVLNNLHKSCRTQCWHRINICFVSELHPTPTQTQTSCPGNSESQPGAKPAKCLSVTAKLFSLSLLESICRNRLVSWLTPPAVEKINGVKCNFSSAHHQDRNIVGKLLIRRVRMWNFTRIGPKTKKLWLLIIQARTLSEQARLGTTPKRCELQLFFAGIAQAIRRWKALDLGSLNMQFQQDWPKD